MRFPVLDHIIWATGMAPTLGVLVFLVRRKLAGELAVISCYAALQLGLGVLHVLPLSWQAYAIAYWIGQIPVSILGLLLVYSFWKSGLAQYRGFYRLCTWVFGITVALLIVFLTTVGWGAASSAEPTQWLNRWCNQMVRSVMFVEAGLMTVFFAFLGAFRIQLSRIVRNVALVWFGFLLFRVPLQEWGATSGDVVMVGRLRSLSFVILMACWTSVVWRHQESEAVEAAPVFAMRVAPQQLAAQMDSMNRSLIRLLQVRG